MLISDPHQYEARFAEVLAVACSIGVAVTFASPVGGVLFSIEIVSVFFSVTSYWHGLNKKFRFYPYVKSDKNRILLGTVERTELQFLLDDYLRKQKSKFTKQNSISVILEEDENEDYESYEQTSKEMSAIEVK
ncbi:Voltage gated chloride channel [Tyrophagus putrescentiae]|nr:Voltage gated chloride channel [Tyrophagus putrescentiae]